MAAKTDDDTVGKIIKLRLEGYTPTEIERTLKISSNSVYKYLAEAGLHKVTKSGAQTKEKCWRGHDLSKTAKFRTDRAGTRYCNECKKINDNRSLQRRRLKALEENR